MIDLLLVQPSVVRIAVLVIPIAVARPLPLLRGPVVALHPPLSLDVWVYLRPHKALDVRWRPISHQIEALPPSLPLDPDSAPGLDPPGGRRPGWPPRRRSSGSYQVSRDPRGLDLSRGEIWQPHATGHRQIPGSVSERQSVQEQVTGEQANLGAGDQGVIKVKNTVRKYWKLFFFDILSACHETLYTYIKKY